MIYFLSGIIMDIAFASDTHKQTRSTAAVKRLVGVWESLSDSLSEADLGANFVQPMLETLGYGRDRRKLTPSTNIVPGPTLKPDYVFYRDIEQTQPVLVIEIKKRCPILAGVVGEDKFFEACQKSSLYRCAIGYDDTGENGIRQYLDIDRVKPEGLAPYGLVLNGDFFQLWRRVDGLVTPITPVQRITAKNLPRLVADLGRRIELPMPALVTALWNRKGGTGKTTNTINIAATLAKLGKRILLIDLDPQADLTNGIGFSSDAMPNYFGAVKKKLDLEEYEAASAVLKAEIQSKEFQGFGCANFTLSLLATSKKHLEDFRDAPDSRSPESRFVQIVQLLKNDFDYIFIDASPAADRLAQCLMYSCDAVLTPIDGAKAIRHAIQLHGGIIPEFQKSRAKVKLSYGPLRLGVMRSNWSPAEGSTLEKAFDEELTKHNFTGKQYGVRLKYYAKAEEAGMKQTPVVCWHNSPITALFKKATEEVFLKHNFIDQ
jgi:chromosome partitioning protein